MDAAPARDRAARDGILPATRAFVAVAALAALAMATLVACAEAGGADVDGVTDRGDTDVADVDAREVASDPGDADAGDPGDVDADADARDGGAHVDVPPPPPVAIGRSVAARLADGREVAGELVAIYDHRAFWFEPEARETWALFDPEALAAAWDEDASFTFVDAREVADVVVTELPAGRRGYRDALRELGLLLARSPLDGVAHVLMAGEAWHLEEDGYGHFALDLVTTGATGLAWRGDGRANADHYVWDAPIALPVAGTVVEVVRDAPDLAPDFDEVPLTAVNNLVGVHVWGGFNLYLLHQRQGSIPADIAPGDWLPVGAHVGRVGNSGVTQLPHLHVVLLWYDVGAGRSWSVPFEFEGLWVAPTDAGASWVAPAAPWTGDWIGDAPF